MITNEYSANVGQTIGQNPYYKYVMDKYKDEYLTQGENGLDYSSQDGTITASSDWVTKLFTNSLGIGITLDILSNNGVLCDFTIDEDLDGFDEFIYSNRNGKETIELDLDSDGNIDYRYNYEDGKIASSTEYLESGDPIFSTYDEEGNKHTDYFGNILGNAVCAYLMGAFSNLPDGNV